MDQWLCRTTHTNMEGGAELARPREPHLGVSSGHGAPPAEVGQRFVAPLGFPSAESSLGAVARLATVRLATANVRLPAALTAGGASEKIRRAPPATVGPANDAANIVVEPATRQRERHRGLWRGLTNVGIFGIL